MNTKNSPSNSQPQRQKGEVCHEPGLLLACAIVWRKVTDAEAGLELLEGLDSPDPNVRALSRALLIDDEENSLRLLEGALIAGVVTPEAAGGCIADILRNRKNKWKEADSERQPWRDSFSYSVLMAGVVALLV